MKALDQAGGNQREVARMLGIDKSTLWRKLDRYRRATVQLEPND